MVKKSKNVISESSEESEEDEPSETSEDDSCESCESSTEDSTTEDSNNSENMIINESESDEDKSFNKIDEELKHNNKRKKKKFNIKFYIDKNIKKKNKNIKKKDNRYKEILKKYNSNEKKYFKNLDLIKKEEIYDKETLLLNDSITNCKEPLRFKFLDLNIPNMSKNIILSKLEQLNDMSPGSSDYYKLKNWINILDKIPLGIYHTLPITNNNINEVSDYLQSVKNTIDTNVYGHMEAKEQIIRILAQWISYPNANGYVIGIKGSMGIGKTKLVKEGICDALKFPFAFISLGGISDASYLKGHSYTYEGSTYGKIVECLIKSKVMNPVLFFDELDKVSSSEKGEEIINTLIHLTDPTQNKNFTDRYFEEIDLDLSKSIIIFTYNNEKLLNPILKDRMITINVNGYTLKEKITISKDYLIKEIMQEYNIRQTDIIFSDNIIKYIIENTTEEEGVRNLKRNINNIISWINVMRYIPHNDIKLIFPFEINIAFVDKFIKKHNNSFIKDVHHSMYT